MITERVNVQSPDFPPGATLEVAINNRATSLYHDEGLAIAAAQPVIADAMGVFSQIYLTREITDSVSITVKDQTGRMLYRATVL